MSETTFEHTLSCAEFVQRARPIRDAYRAGEITYTQLRRELERIQPKPVQSARQQCSMALSWLKKSREKGKALMWREHGQYLVAARRSIELIESPVWRARMTCAADEVAKMANHLLELR